MLVRGANDVVLESQIIEEKFHWIIGVRLDPTNARGRENDYFRPFSTKKRLHCGFVCQIQLRARPGHKIRVTFRSKMPNQRAAH
jgi:hypothetical protein